MLRLLLLPGLIVLVGLSYVPSHADDVGLMLPGLNNYIKRPEPSFTWKLDNKKEVAGSQTYLIKMTSQKWQNIEWTHDLLVVVPAGVKPGDSMLIFNTGGQVDNGGRTIAALIAGRLKAPVAFLFGIPNQPLFNGKSEDALIAETYVKYLETKDESWPLLFPMVKSLIMSMDALQAFAKDEWKTELKHFIISGASKRGWTSWLTGATGDPRVKAIAPMVIDTLNMQVQMPHQHEMLGGKYSEQIADYTERGLVPMPDTSDARKLWAMVDPWVYREKLTMPKMIINGSNDEYWAVDALNFYWNDLKGPKWVLIVPNAGHDLAEVNKDGKKDSFPTRGIATLVAFNRSQITNQPMPNLTWKHDDVEGKMRLTVNTDKGAKKARIWVAQNPNQDFRPARWNSQDAEIVDGKVVVTLDKPKSGYQAFFAEVDYGIDELNYSLSTQLRLSNSK
ncbi:MAG: PhoPQ-activated protein PqaA family protein [Gemmatales bacterium]